MTFLSFNHKTCQLLVPSMLPMAPYQELKDDSPKTPPIDAPCTPESATTRTTRTTLPTPPSSYLGYHDDPDDLDENDGNDSDSAYGDSLATDDTKTLSTYITAYPYEFGRRYHAFHDGAYWGPNDDIANEQQSLTHHMYLLMLEGRLHLAPLDNPKEILDVGTGTGMWAIDMADTYPNAQVTGVDLSPTQPAFVPPNCAFEIDDMTLSWTYPDNHFDMIHIRELFGSIPDWNYFFGQCYNALKPGAYLEIVEHATFPIDDDGSIGPDSFYRVWESTMAQAAAKTGKSYTIWAESADRLRECGYEDVVERHYKWPMNERWSDDHNLNQIGLCNRIRLNRDLEGLILRHLTVNMGWGYARAAVFIARARACVREEQVHAYQPVTVVTARKPLYTPFSSS